MAYVAMAYVFMAYVVMTYVVMAGIVMTLIGATFTVPDPSTHPPLSLQLSGFVQPPCLPIYAAKVKHVVMACIVMACIVMLAYI